METNWLDITVIGSSYEEQIDAYSDRRRHRPRTYQPFYLGDMTEPFVEEEWRPGPAPKA